MTGADTRRQQGGSVPPPPVDRTLTAAGGLPGNQEDK